MLDLSTTSLISEVLLGHVARPKGVGGKVQTPSDTRIRVLDRSIINSLLLPVFPLEARFLPPYSGVYKGYRVRDTAETIF